MRIPELYAQSCPALSFEFFPPKTAEMEERLWSAIKRLDMNRPVRTGVPVRVTSLTSTTPRAVVTSSRRPFFEATISKVWVPPLPVSTTISTRSPRMPGR